MNANFSSHRIPEFNRYFVAYLRTDPAKEPLATGESIPGIIADAAAKTRRHRTDFEVEEISRERYEKLRQFLAQ
jgi:hypothetical protein